MGTDGWIVYRHSKVWHYISVMFKHLAHITIILATAIGFTACAHFEPDINPHTEVELPPTFSLFGEPLSRAQPWWQVFDNTELSDFIEAALSDSFTLQQAWAQLHQARARSIQQNAARFPSLTGGGEAGLGRRRVENDNTRNGGQTNTVENYAVSLISNYELDLWGRVRAVGEAARLDENASLADLQAAAMTVSAEIAQRWVNIISQRLQQSLLQTQLETNKVRLELVELRYRNGLASSVDVFQQRELVARVKRQVPLVETQEALNMNQLALLLGNPKAGSPVIGATALPQLKKIPTPGIPADLLANRPDVRAVGMRLEAAGWQWAAARAARLPAIRLTGTARYGAEELDLIFSNWLINLAANLTAPIFDAGQRAAEADRARALLDEQMARYRQTVFTAFLEVENAMIVERNLHRSQTALEVEIDNAQKALTEATNRYRKGLGDYLPVLTQLVNVQNLERTLIQRQEEIVLARIGLHRALGGSWFENVLAEPSPDKSSTSPAITDLSNG